MQGMTPVHEETENIDFLKKLITQASMILVDSLYSHIAECDLPPTYDSSPFLSHWRLLRVANYSTIMLAVLWAGHSPLGQVLYEFNKNK